MAYKVFISYSTADIAIANRLAYLLRSPDIDVFIAAYSVLPGTGLAQAILDNIHTSDLFVLLWSENSRWSEWVPQEIGIAHSSNKTILPVVLHSRLELPGFIRNLRYLPAHENLPDSLNWLQHFVFENAHKQQQTQAVTLLIIGGLALWALRSEDKGGR